jgi:hypothetical protein
MSVDGRVHHEVIRGFVTDGHPPDLDALAGKMGVARDEVMRSLRRLHEQHGLVLHPDSTAIWVAPPFSSSPTGAWVASGARGWWAPCAWCAMGIVVLAAPEATIHVRIGGESRPAEIVVRGGEIASEDLFVHFAIPARDAWNNVVHYCATVLPFERVEDVAQWCTRHALPRGDVVPLTRVLVLAREWYRRHLDIDWRKWTLAEAQAIFDKVGLRGDTWRLPGGQGIF